jgi:hypothetical protein
MLKHTPRMLAGATTLHAGGMTYGHCSLAVTQKIRHLAGAVYVTVDAASGTGNRRRRQAAGTPVAGFGPNFEGQGRSSRGGACAAVRRAIKGGAGHRHGMRIQDRRPQRTPHRGLIGSRQGPATSPLRARVVNHTRAAALVQCP